jgi:hypothetical protein
MRCPNEILNAAAMTWKPRFLLRCSRAALILTLALPLAACAGWLDRSKSEEETTRRFLSQLQLGVMGFADRYVDTVARACTRAQSEEAIDPRLRYRLMDFQTKQAMAAVQIAAGPDPNINAVDMVVLASLTRKAVARNLPESMGTKAESMIEAFARLEQGAWSLVHFLTPAQQADLRRRLAAWPSNVTSLDTVAFNRLADLAKVGGPPVNEQNAENSILALIGIDPLAKLNPAAREIERGRILGERAIYYPGRTPVLLDLQARASAAAVAAMPETRAMLATANHLGESSAVLAETISMLPKTFSKERDATIQQMVTAVEQQQGTVKQLLVEARQSFEAGHGASDSVQGMLDRLEALLRRLRVGEPAQPGAVSARPFDITEYTRAAETVGDTMKQLQTLISMLERDAPAATLLGDTMRAHAERVIDHVFERVVQAIGVLFVAALLIVLTSRFLRASVAPRDATRTSATEKVR